MLYYWLRTLQWSGHNGQLDKGFSWSTWIDEGPRGLCYRWEMPECNHSENCSSSRRHCPQSAGTSPKHSSAK